MAGGGLVEQGCRVVERTIRVKHNRKKYEGSMVGLLGCWAGTIPSKLRGELKMHCSEGINTRAGGGRRRKPSVLGIRQNIGLIYRRGLI